MSNDPRAGDRLVVLLVDDQQFVGAAVRQLLASETDIDFHHCTKAVEAIPYANRIAPAIILQDLMMPDVDGFTLVRMYRLNPATSRVPVIVLSGNDDAATRTRALGDGAVDYVVKLPKKADLVACIRRHASTRAGAPAPPPTPAPPPQAAGATLDRAVLESLSEMGSPEFARGLIDQFIAEAGACVQTLVAAAGRREAHTLKATAHSLKGSSMIVGATALARLCGEIESRVAADQSDRGADLAADVEREFGRVREALAAQQASGHR